MDQLGSLVENNRSVEPGWPAILLEAQAVLHKSRATETLTIEESAKSQTAIPAYHQLLLRAKHFQATAQINNILLNLTVAAFHVAMLDMVCFQN